MDLNLIWWPVFSRLICQAERHVDCVDTHTRARADTHTHTQLTEETAITSLYSEGTEKIL